MKIKVYIDHSQDWAVVTADSKKLIEGHISDVLETGEFLARLRPQIDLSAVTLADIDVEYAAYEDGSS